MHHLHQHSIELSLLAFFILGLSGSLHCVFMCGPLSVMVLKESHSPLFLVFYHLARFISYASLAFLLKFFSLHTLPEFWLQLSFVLLILFLLLYLFEIPFPRQVENALQKAIQFLLPQKPVFRNLTLGFLTPLLPCGLLYSALAGSQMAASSLMAFSYMLAFGLGTTVLLFVSQLLWQQGMKIKQRAYMRMFSKGGAALVLIFMLYMKFSH